MKKTVASNFALSRRTAVLLVAALALTVFGLTSFRAGAQDGSWFEFSYPIEPEDGEPNGKEPVARRDGLQLITKDLVDNGNPGDQEIRSLGNSKNTRLDVVPNLAAPNGAVPATPFQSEIEPNGSVGTATAIATPARIRANLFPNGDIDFYSFTAAAGDRIYAAAMTSASAGNSTDGQLTLLASDGTTVIEFDDDNGSFAALSPSIAGAVIPATGTYYIRYNDFTAGTTSQRGYELYVVKQSGSPTPEEEPNDTPGTADTLPANGWVSGTRNPASGTEQDWFEMVLNAGDTVYLGLDLNPERDGVVWNGRLGIALFGDAGNQILVVDDAGTGDVSPVPNNPSEAMFFTVKNSGTYFAFVDSASAAVGGPTATYHLSVAVFPKVDEGINCTTYVSTDVPKAIGPGTGLVSSTITVPGNPRIADIDVSIQLNHALMQDIDAHLRSPAGNDNGLFTDIGSAATGGQSQMDITFDDEAAIPPLFTALRPIVVKPENNSTAGTASTSGAYRLDWFDGENAGGVWTLDLRDDTAGANGGTLTGWSIRICEQPPSLPTVIYSEDFEGGDGGFTHSGAQDEWELGLPSTAATTGANPIAPFNTCNSGTNCWKTDLDNTYNASSNQDLVSPNINLTAYAGQIELEWAMRHQIETANFDRAYVSVRQVGNPASERRVWQWLGPTPISASAGTGNPQVNIGGSAGWGIHRADISSFAGQIIEVVFHLDSDSSVQFGGMAIDDVSVRTVVLNTPPTINAVAVSRPQATTANVTIANVSDAEDAENDLVVSVIGPTTVNGVTISGISVNSAGVVTATVATSCGASNASFTLQVVDTGTLSSTTALNVTVTPETIPPVINPVANIVVTLPPSSMATSVPVTYPTISASDNCSAPTLLISPPSGSIFNLGTTTVTVTATDGVGNSSELTFTVTVLYNFSGFFGRLSVPPPGTNFAVAGNALPVSFSLSGFKGYSIFAPGSPSSRPVNCMTGAPTGPSVPAILSMGLLYFPDQYTMFWQTDPAWSGTCRQFAVALIDGSTKTANVRFYD